MAERTLAPIRKVLAGGVAGAAAFLLVSIGNRYGLSISAEEAVAFNTLLSGVVSYLIPNKIDTDVSETEGG